MWAFGCAKDCDYQDDSVFTNSQCNGVKLPVGMAHTIVMCITCRQGLALSAACWPLHNRACFRAAGKHYDDLKTRCNDSQ